MLSPPAKLTRPLSARATTLLFASMLALGIAAIIPLARAGATDAPQTTIDTHRVWSGESPHAGARTPARAVPHDTSVVALRWSGDAEAEFKIETRDAGGKWTSAGDAAAPDGGADPGSADARRADRVVGNRHVTEPLPVNDPSRVRVRVGSGVDPGEIHDVDLVAIGAPSGSTSGGGLNPIPLPAGVVLGSIGFVGLTLRDRRRAGALLVVVVIAGTALGAAPARAAAPGDVPPPGNPGVISRVAWGADEGARRRACPEGPGYSDPELVVVHHTAGSNSYSPGQSAATMRGLLAYFINIRGYCDVAYNFLVDKYGQIFEGRYGGIASGVIGAHATGFNTGTVGVAMMGDFSNVSVGPALFQSVGNLLAWKMTVSNLNPFAPVTKYGRLVDPIIGHRDSGAIVGDPTGCPGNRGYSILPALRASVRPRVAFGYPWGSVDSAKREPTQLHLTGWAVDPDTPAPIRVHIYVDGVNRASVVANKPRPSVGARWPRLGANHGFDTTIPVGPGSHRTCTYAINVANGSSRLLKCVTVDARTRGAFDGAQRAGGPLRVTGWALDPDTASPIRVHVYVDGRPVAGLDANLPRTDIDRLFVGYGPNHGFDATVAVPPGSHFVCVYGISTRGKPNPLLGCRRYSGRPFGVFDAAVRSGNSVQVTGWTIDPDTAAPIRAHVYVDGHAVVGTTADVSRPSVGAAYPGYGPNHGFDATVAVASGRHRVCMYAISVLADPNTLLGCRTV